MVKLRFAKRFCAGGPGSGRKFGPTGDGPVREPEEGEGRLCGQKRRPNQATKNSGRKRLVDKVECYEIREFEKLVSNFMLQK